MRTAGRMPPWIETRPTPPTSASRLAISVSARSLMSRSVAVSEVSASVMIGALAGFTLE